MLPKFQNTTINSDLYSLFSNDGSKPVVVYSQAIKKQQKLISPMKALSLFFSSLLIILTLSQYGPVEAMLPLSAPLSIPLSTPISSPENIPVPVSAPDSGTPISMPISVPISVPPISSPISSPINVVPIVSNSNSAEKSTSSNRNNMPQPCTAVRPQSAPYLSATVLSGTQLSIHWTSAKGQVTHYLLEYGRENNHFEYGNTNIGGKDVNQFVIKSLNPNQTYYIRIRAMDNCIGGDYSNTVSVKTIVASGKLDRTYSYSNVLGSMEHIFQNNTKNPSVSNNGAASTGQNKPQPKKESNGIIAWIQNFMNWLLNPFRRK